MLRSHHFFGRLRLRKSASHIRYPAGYGTGYKKGRIIQQDIRPAGHLGHPYLLGLVLFTERYRYECFALLFQYFTLGQIDLLQDCSVVDPKLFIPDPDPALNFTSSGSGSRQKFLIHVDPDPQPDTDPPCIN